MIFKRLRLHYPPLSHQSTTSYNKNVNRIFHLVQGTYFIYHMSDCLNQALVSYLFRFNIA